jgi:hypothetical protein
MGITLQVANAYRVGYINVAGQQSDDQYTDQPREDILSQERAPSGKGIGTGHCDAC